MTWIMPDGSLYLSRESPKEIIISPLSTSRNKSVKVPDNQLLESNHSKYLLIDFKNDKETGKASRTSLLLMTPHVRFMNPFHKLYMNTNNDLYNQLLGQ